MYKYEEDEKEKLKLSEVASDYAFLYQWMRGSGSSSSQV